MNYKKSKVHGYRVENGVNYVSIEFQSHNLNDILTTDVDELKQALLKHDKRVKKEGIKNLSVQLAYTGVIIKSNAQTASYDFVYEYGKD